MHHLRWLFLALVRGLPALAPAACGIVVEEIPIATPLATPEQARSVPVRLSKIEFGIRRGTLVGDVDSWGAGLDCVGPSEQLNWPGSFLKAQHAEYKDLFHEELKAAGYDVTSDPAVIHEESLEEDELRTELSVTARITEMKVKLCTVIDPVGRFLRVLTMRIPGPEGQRGEASLRVDWTVYSRVDRRVVLRTATRGYADIATPMPDGPTVVVLSAFASAVANLLADTGFHAVAFDDPASHVPGMPTAGRPGPRPAAPVAGPLVLEGAAPLDGPFAASSGRVTSAAVTVSAGMGHGSGTIISPLGWILTNSRVVGSAERARVRLHDGTALVGRVERRHPARNVALVKVDAWGLPFLPVRHRPLRVGEDVHAIGTPLTVHLHTTVTRGIVSAFRTDRPTGLDLIQADAAIAGGSGGGPLVDAAGNLVGLSAGGYGEADGNTGLNLFIPIEDALDRLGIQMVPAVASP